ncbi:RHS repeat-associated core domain-containing protein [Amycolatopsis sp. NPDC004079]|uniref:RHS repeat-associated core domain-containing protein n=1 Tax=Amycolatopsis sp. NPDC004079 TaxID=3154549 RepID=UPI0033A54C73
MRKSPTHRTRRGITAALICSLVLTAVSTENIASAAGGPSVPLPTVNSTKVTQQTMTPRAPDEASTRALRGNQPAGSTAPDGGGNSKATSLSPSATWDVSAQTGDFSWSYPLEVPPVPGDLTPNLGLSYSSSAVDGRTSATNNQASWVGDGWDLAPGFVERTYGACRDDKEGGTTPPKVGDLCWKSDNATAAYNGSGGMLIHDTTKNVWRQRSDTGARIEHLTGAGNGAKDGESWKITTTDGTQYFFGSTASANSTWTVPVYGDDAGEPCHAASGNFEESSCVQGYRWNLDKVIDPHGNEILYTYDVETNNYGQNGKDTPVSYVRGGTLREIQYGLNTHVAAPAVGKVVFTTADRCIPGSQCTFDKPENWPDVPLSDRCDTASCKDHPSPTFWSTKRLAKITTQVRSGTGYADVNSWSLDQQFPDPGDGEKAALWLKGITRTGLVGTPISVPPVTFEGKHLANRVDKADGIGPLNRYRLSAIISESGGVTTVNYADLDCTATSLPANPETNTKRCFPTTWAPLHYAERTDYFQKYVVSSVVQSDRISSSTEQLTSYEYPEGAAWHYSTSEFTSDDKKTWNEFRGFGKVIVRNGRPDDPSGPQSYSETRYFRGMNGDKLPNNGTRVVSVSDDENGSHPDEDWLQGYTLETITKNGANGPVVGKSISEPSWQGPTATRDTYKAYIVHPGTSRSLTALAAGGWRTTKTTTAYDANGLPTQVSDLGDVSDPADDKCTTTTYAQNTALWMLSYPSRVESTTVACGTPPVYPRDAGSDAVSFYDNQPAGAAPTVGDVTSVQDLDRYDNGKPVYRAAAKTERDVYGRTTKVIDAVGHEATSIYTPATGGPVTQLVTANTLNQKTTTVFEPAWGAAKTTTDPNGRVKEIAYDALGRNAEIWLPNRPRPDNPQGNTRFAYDIRNDGPSAVSTTSVNANGRFVTATTIYDSFYRPRQVQSPAPGGGRLLVDTRYDSQNRAYKTTQPFYNDQNVDTKLWVASDTEIPGFTVTQFDGAGRSIAAVYQAGGAEKWRTTTTYGGDWTSVTPPAGGVPTTTVTDARGRTRALRQYHGAQPTGDYDETTYGYTAANQLASVTDSSGNHWTYSYDLHGQLKQANDPDRGTTTYAYNELGQQVSTTDARNVTLAYSYDALGRKTGTYQGSTTGTKMAEWVYDTAFKGVGQLASSTRWVNGNAYAEKVNAYSPLYQPTIQTVTIPAVEGPKLAGSYTTYLSYNPDGSVGGSSFPAAGDLAVESMLYAYDDLGHPITTNGDADYVTASDYSRYGEIQRLQLGQGDHRVWQSYYYDDHTRRLDRTIVDAEVPHPMQADTHYAYNPAGNITSISNTPQDQPADTQCFRYDYLRRLTDAWTPPAAACDSAPSTASLTGPAPYWQSFTYDKSGNRLTDTQHTSAGEVTRKYSYADPGVAKPHQLNSTSVPGKPDSQYTYDQIGNTKTRPGIAAQQNLDWTLEGQLDSVVEGSAKTSFVYDAGGSRLLRHDPSGTTLYLGGQEIHADSTGQSVSTTRYYSHGSGIVAVRTSGKLTWLAGDHQGTSQIAVDSTDLSVTQRRQDPFGTPRGPATDLPGERGFVGGTEDRSTGLTQLGARAYDSAAGRFLSLDPVFNPASPQQINGYSYANNSPVSSSDPSGLEPMVLPPGCGDSLACREKGYGSSPRSAWDADTERVEQAADQKQRAGWVKRHSPRTSNRADVYDLFQQARHMPSSIGWWDNSFEAVGENQMASICFGRTGCWKALQYLIEHKNDVEGAKVIAATYCLDNYRQCERESGISLLGDLGMSVAGGLGAGGARSVSASGARNIAKEAAEALRIFGLRNGSVGKDANVAAAEVLIEGESPQLLQSVSGRAPRDGTVPKPGDVNNPIRYKATATGKNNRKTDTEIKLLTYIANNLGEPSPYVRGTINIHTEKAMCISCQSVVRQFESEFPGVRVNVTEGGWGG